MEQRSFTPQDATSNRSTTLNDERLAELRKKANQLPDSETIAKMQNEFLDVTRTVTTTGHELLNPDNIQ